MILSILLLSFYSLILGSIFFFRNTIFSLLYVQLYRWAFSFNTLKVTFSAVLHCHCQASCQSHRWSFEVMYPFSLNAFRSVVSLQSCCAFTCIYSARDLLSFLNWRTHIFVQIWEIFVHCCFKWYPPFSPSVSSVWLDIRPYSVLCLLIFIYSYNLFISLCCILHCILSYMLMFIIYLVVMFNMLMDILIGNTCISPFKTCFSIMSLVLWFLYLLLSL